MLHETAPASVELQVLSSQPQGLEKAVIAHSSSFAVTSLTGVATQNTPRHCFTADNHDQPDLPYRSVLNTAKVIPTMI